MGGCAKSSCCKKGCAAFLGIVTFVVVSQAWWFTESLYGYAGINVAEDFFANKNLWLPEEDIQENLGLIAASKLSQATGFVYAVIKGSAHFVDTTCGWFDAGVMLWTLTAASGMLMTVATMPVALDTALFIAFDGFLSSLVVSFLTIKVLKCRLSALAKAEAAKDKGA